MRLRFLLTVALLALAAGCAQSEPFVPNIEDTQFASSLNVDLANSVKTASGLYYRDVTVGGGAEVPAGTATSVTTTYAGYLRTGSQFDAGSFTFTTLSSQVIAGFDEGVRGMRVGGTRQLIIPPSLGYGGTRAGSIPPNSILVFNVTLTAIN